MSGETLGAKVHAARIAARVAAVAVWSAQRLGRGLAWIGAGTWRRRGAVVAVLARAAWWGALVAWWSAAVSVLGGGLLDLDRALLSCIAGAIACAVVVASSRASRLRWLGGALGSLHGASAVVLWFVANAA